MSNGKGVLPRSHPKTPLRLRVQLSATRGVARAAAICAALTISAGAAGPILMVPNGAVEVRSGPTAAWHSVTEQQPMLVGQEIRTARDSKAELRFSDGSRVALGNSSIFAIDRADAREARFSLTLGTLRAAFAGLLSSRVSIRTPTAVCAVRGTVFDLGADANQTRVTMAEGTLEVKDNQGKQAVVNSEETLDIGEHGLGHPRMLSLSDSRSLQAVRPYAVHQEMARDATREMLENMRNRELKANEAQLGKDVVDAFGRRVRLEEYLLRPDTKSFELLFLSRRESRFDWGHLIETFHDTIPDDLSQVPAIVASGMLTVNQPSNWLKSMEFYATNTVDAEKEKILLGDPTQINFSGFSNGVSKLLWYPSTIDFIQTLMGPGVPGGLRDQFKLHQDFNATSAGLFTWQQSIVNNVGTMALLNQFQLDPTNAADVGAGGCASTKDTCSDNSAQAQFAGLSTLTSFPSGPTKADLFSQTTYPDGSTIGVEKFLVSNDGKILDFASPTANTFNQDGSYNLEINIKSNLFQGRDIDVLIAPEILSQKKQDTTTANNLQP